VVGGKLGTTKLTAHMKNPDGSESALDLPVEVRDPATPTCGASDTAQKTLGEATPSMNGAGALADASVASPKGAFVRTDFWKLPSFDAKISCGADLAGPLGGDTRSCPRP